MEGREKLYKDNYKGIQNYTYIISSCRLWDIYVLDFLGHSV